jgi:hypothetical protein
MQFRLAIFSLAAAASAVAAPSLDFNRDVRPILSDKCWACHGPDGKHRKADLRLDTFAGATEDLGGYQAIVPGDPKKSEAMVRILSRDKDEVMPPPEAHKVMTPKEIDVLTRWIASGAEYADAWTYVTPKKTPVPKTRHQGYNWVDNFVHARLDEEGIKPSPKADAHTLIRRLTFDLTGLPPTPTEVEAFVADSSPKAYETAVDRLLASTAYGERMATYWLDLVRAADTVGYHGDQDHRISPYRDYVIAAFNQNMPFDQFTREQIAGDLLPNPTLSQKVATCYNRLLQTSHEGGVQAKEYRAIYQADRVRNVSNVWMGATVGCAQCHDHKYDPYTMKDFYAMAAFFADVDDEQHFKSGTNSLPTKRLPEIPVAAPADLEAHKALVTEVKQLESKLKKHPKPDKVPKLNTPPNATAAQIADAKAKIEEVVSRNAELKEQRKNLDEQIRSKRATRDALGKKIRYVMVTQATKPRTVRILPRGNWLDDSGEIVTPAIPEFMGKLPVETRATRLDFANWLVADGHSGLLTARVQVNRFWYLLFGSGIAKVLDDFGGQGEPAANLQLLDNLAVAFVDSGWDVKAMMKLLVMTKAYQQTSITSPQLYDRDPDNQLAARQLRYRMPAEMIRDNALSVSGLLVNKLEGDPVKPYQPAGYYRHLNFPTRKYSHHTDDRQWRRGVYVHWQRQFLHPMLKAFDAPTREECTAQRPRSNTPTAALVLLNDPTFVEAAKMLAVRLIQEKDDPNARIQHAATLAWSRPPTTTESATLRKLYAADLAHYKGSPEAAQTLLKTGIKPVPTELNPAEVAAWTSVARAILSTNETITRN